MIYDNLSFVIQGVLDQRTAALAASIVQHFPGAEIIQSTNLANAKPQGPCDHFRIVPDPIELDGENNRHLNRLIATSYEGLKLASRPTVIKLRSDLLFHNNTIYHSWYNWLELYEKQFGTEFKIFDVPVGILNYYTVDPSSPHPYCLPYHPSDWLMIGRREDLLEYFNIPHKQPYEVYRTDKVLAHRIEQYPAICNLIKRGHPVSLVYDLDASQANIENTYRFLVNNFVVFDMYNVGITSQKYRMNPHMNCLFNNEKWQEFSNFFTNQRTKGI